MIGKDLNLNQFIPLESAKKKSINRLKLITDYLNVGFYLVIPLLASLYVGILIDKYYRTKPIFTLVFIFFGLVIDFYEFKKLIRESRESK